MGILVLKDRRLPIPFAQESLVELHHRCVGGSVLGDGQVVKRYTDY